MAQARRRPPARPRGGIRFSPVLEFGHIFQAIILVSTMIGVVWAAYATIQTQIIRQDASALLLTQRADHVEKNAADIRETLDKISLQIADLRTLVAGRR